MNADISLLREDVFKRAAAAVFELQNSNIPFCITSTLRTYDEQAALYAQGRSSIDVVNALRKRANMPLISNNENTYIVTKCNGISRALGGTGRSAHQLGIALDIVPVINGKPSWPNADAPEWKEISLIMKRYNFTWGGDWTDFKDLPHYQYDV